MSWCNKDEHEASLNIDAASKNHHNNKACPRRRKKYCCPASQFDVEAREISEASRLLGHHNNNAERGETSSPDLVAELQTYMASRLFHKYILSEKDFVEVTTKYIFLYISSNQIASF